MVLPEVQGLQAVMVVMVVPDPEARAVVRAVHLARAPQERHRKARVVMVEPQVVTVVARRPGQKTGAIVMPVKTSRKWSALADMPARRLHSTHC